MADKSHPDHRGSTDVARAVSDLFRACTQGLEPTVRLLLMTYDIDLETKTRNRTPLLEACWHGHKTTAEILISAGSDVNAKDHEEFSCMHVAAYCGFTDLLSLLLRHGANIEALDDANSTPFAMAALNGHESSMRLLARKGANVNPLADDRVSPLALACCTGADDKVRLLLELGANPKTRVCAEPRTSRNAVFANAGESCLLQVVRFMWQAGLVSEAARGLARRHLAIAEMLIEGGANLHQRCQGFTAVHYAAGIGSRRLMTSLLRFGASTSTLASLGINGAPVTALCWAAAYSRPLMVSLLLQAGALEDVDDGNGCCLLGAIGSFAGRMGPVTEKDVEVRSRAVFHELVRGPAFRARSFLWPVAVTADGQEGGGKVPQAPAAAAVVQAAAASTAPKVSKGKAKRRVLPLPRYGECGGRGTPVGLSAMLRYAAKTDDNGRL